MAEKQIVPADFTLPDHLTILPTVGVPVFPGIFTPMLITSKRDIAVVEKAIVENSILGILLIKGESSSEPQPEELHRIGTVARIARRINLPDGGINIFVSTLKRFEVRRFISKEKVLTAAVEYLEDQRDKTNEVKALTRSLIAEMKRLSQNNPLFTEEMRLNMVNIDQPGKIADFISSIINIDRDQQQEILETLDVQKRMEQVLVYIRKEQELLKIQKRVQQKINEKIEKSQREYFLREELKAIKVELGMPTDPKSGEYKRFKDAIEALPLEGEVAELVSRELEKFNLMDPNASEFVVTRNYLDTIVSLPWTLQERGEFDIQKGQRILNADHYGLEDVKERILEYLAVRKLKQTTKGSIICLVGAPGVGKTSIGKSVARALNREFFRFSVGGMRDEAEIKGHRRTYVGAMPGKIIQGLKTVKVKDPVFMIDEIDKMGVSYQGDPSSALLEVLDPEQNFAFRDHYLDLPFDISHILFIATANTLDSIPSPLIDRMEVIRLSGYVEDEKISIARKYLLPKSLAKAGLNRKDVKYPRRSLSTIAGGYAREAGVRNLEKSLDRIHRKLAKKIVLQQGEPPFEILPDQIEEYLGKPVFKEDHMKVASSPGTAIGLAWTTMGGDTLIIETAATPGKENYFLTGQMGKVMQESASIAYTHVRQISSEYGVSMSFFEDNLLHIHIPEGATPKDGPSAGITMATALLSLARGKVIRKNTAMTGELSLVGRVLPIGGLKEKTIAARRNGVRTIILPHGNLKDLDEIPDRVKKGIHFIPVTTMREVLEEVF